MKAKIPNVLIILTLTLAAPAFAGQPAARVGDTMQSGGVIIGPGAATVLIGGAPAARVGDFATDPFLFFQAPNVVIPCVGGPIFAGSSTVMIGGQPAARVGDRTTIACPLGVDVIMGGSFTVLIGN
jgi:uncharacterized Zn-binding protein involved in type VI secretion